MFQTGTLTEEGLDLWGAVPTGNSSKEATKTRRDGGEGKEIFSDLSTTSSSFQAPVREVDHLSPGPFLIGMAACHSLTRIDGNLIGDPLDLKVRHFSSFLSSFCSLNVFCVQNYGTLVYLTKLTSCL